MAQLFTFILLNYFFQLQVAEMEVRVEKRYASVYAEIKLLTQSYLSQIEERGKELLTRLDTIHKVKMTTLAHQKRELASTTVCLAQVGFPHSS